jgi:hypothetical protein
MMKSVKMKTTFPYLSETLRRGSMVSNPLGEQVDLTKAERIIMFVKEEGGSAKFHGNCLFTNPTTGVVVFEQTETQISVPGKYEVEWEVLWENGTVSRFPEEGAVPLSVLPRLIEEEQGAEPEIGIRRDYEPLLGYTVDKGTWAPAYTGKGGSGEFGSAGRSWYLENTTAANADAVQYIVDPTEGVWSISIAHMMKTNGGKVGVYLDGVKLGEFNCYAAAELSWAESTFTKIDVNGSEGHVLKFEVLGKETGSSAYQLPLIAFSMEEE